MGTNKDMNWVIGGHFMQVLPVEYNRVPKSYTADSRAHMDHRKRAMSDDGGETDHSTPFKQACRPATGI